MSENMVIKSGSGPYSVFFTDDAFANLLEPRAHYIIDKKVATLYRDRLHEILKAPSVHLIEATEEAKTLDRFTGYVENLVEKSVRRGDKLVAVGGGIIQDITCFLASTLLRGIDWHFCPTTLLAQADSCIGSKSSINVGKYKNLLGTFTPAKKIFIETGLLGSLSDAEIKSGIGEILKVHIIDGKSSFAEVASRYDELLKGGPVLEEFIAKSLNIKKRFIEEDEFDRGIRNVLNYGHSFGHAIEAATNFAIPHGIAVTMGMDLANYFSLKKQSIPESEFQFYHSTLKRNYTGYEQVHIPQDRFTDAIMRDKKNVDQQLKLIVLNEAGRVAPHLTKPDQAFTETCSEFLERVRL